MNFLFFFLILALGFIGFIILLIFNVIRNIFSLGLKRNRFSQNQNNSQQDSFRKSGKKKKVFESNEGEYVDFEEIKD